MPGEIDRRRAQRAVRRRDLDDVALRDAEPRGRLRIDLDPAAPHRRGQRIGHLLQPRQMRSRSVEERAATRTAGSGTDTAPRRRRIAARDRGRSAGRRRLPAAAPATARACRSSSTHRSSAAESRDSCQHLVDVFHGSGAAAASSLPRDLEQHVRRRARLVERLHRRAGHARDGRDRARFGRGVDPRLEERVIGQNQIGQHARLVEEAAEAGDERHLLERLADLPRRRRAEHRIRAVDEQHLRGDDRPPMSAAAFERLRGRAATAAPALRREEHAARLPDAAEQRVQRVDRERREQAVGVRQRRAADDRDRRLRARRARARAVRCASPATPVTLLDRAPARSRQVRRTSRRSARPARRPRRPDAACRRGSRARGRARGRLRSRA